MYLLKWVTSTATQTKLLYIAKNKSIIMFNNHSQIHHRNINPEYQQHLINSGTHPLLARLYAARSVTSVAELNDGFNYLLPYQSLLNCEQAACKLANAIEHQQRILIIADYDADGATACAVAIKALSQFGAIVDFIVPNRFQDGYGLTIKLAEEAHNRKVDLLLTVDNGIASIDGVAKAKELGIDVLITDHHLPGQQLPDCMIVNPNQPNCTFKSKNLAGVGVIYYVMIALRAELRKRQFFNAQRPEPNLAELLDLVALGTISDVVPLDHNNRILVSQGLKRIRAGKMSQGIQALFQVARRDYRKARPFDIGFTVGPRINAAGRLDDMSIGIACLLTNDSETAQQIADDLNTLNQTRQEIEKGMLQDALKNLPTTIHNQQTSICIYHQDFHQGVVGILASRLKEQFYRPTIIFAPADNQELRGSGRSIHGIHLRDILDIISKRYPNLILKFGGHAMAAGLSIHQDKLVAFQAAFEKVISETIEPSILTKTFITDGQLNATDITLQQAILLNQQVWGQGFPAPSFDDIFQVVRYQPMGKAGIHTKAWLNKDGHIFEAMFWKYQGTLPEHIHIVYQLIANEWNGHQELQLYVDYWEEVA